MAKKTTSTKTTKSKAAVAKAGPAKAKSGATTLEETLAQLKSLGDEKVRAQNAKRGAGDNQFGVKLGDLRVLAKKIKTNHELALALWKTGNIDAQFLATLLMRPQDLSAPASATATAPLRTGCSWGARRSGGCGGLPW